MEFRITIKDETEKEWAQCTNGNTELYYIEDGGMAKTYITKDNFTNITKIEIRRKGKENEIVEVYSKETKTPTP